MVFFTDVMNLKKENERLQNVIDQIRNDQFALQVQVEKLQQKLADQYDKYRSEVNPYYIVSIVHALQLGGEKDNSSTR